ncbi:MAG: PAS domain S-box protein [Aeromonadaceae bacterium]|nr:PAS domain S-box protein [Aeromonadaceae bacterium]
MSTPITRHFIHIFFPVALLIVAGGALLKHKDDAVTLERLQLQQHQAIRRGMDVLNRELASVHRDLRFIASQPELRQALQQDAKPDLAALSRNLLMISNLTQHYDQVRWIDEQGDERVRIDRHEGTAVTLPPDQLTNKKLRYYFRAAMAQPPGSIYVAPLDLDLAPEIQVSAARATMRFATQVIDSQGRQRGFIILNYLAAPMLDKFVKITEELATHSLLVDDEGHWLAGHHPAVSTTNTQGNDLAMADPELWQQIRATKQGQQLTESGLWSWQTLTPQRVADNPDQPASAQETLNWKVMTWVPSQELATMTQPSLRHYSLAVAVLIAGLGFISWRLAQSRQRHDETQAEMVRSKNRYHALFDSTINPILLFTRDPEALLDCNSATLAIFGATSKTELIGKTTADLSPPWQPNGKESAQAMQSHLAQAERNVSTTFEWTYKRLDTGKHLFVTIRLTQIHIDDQPLLLASFRDITERVQAQSQIRSALQRLKLATDAAKIGIWSWSFNDSTLEWDDRMCDWFEVPESKRHAGKYQDFWRSRLHPDDLARAESRLHEALVTDSPYQDEFRLLRSDGSIRYIQTTSIIDYDMERKPLRMIGINADITAQRELEATLRAAKLSADAANNAKSEFLANMSHEIRTPMNAVLGLTQLLLGDTLTHRQRDYLGKIQLSASALLGILNDILDFSKIETGNLGLESTPFAIDELLDTSRALFAYAAEEKQLTLQFSRAANLPLTLQGDPLRLQQILNNLLSNALKFTHSGGVRVHVANTLLRDNRVQLHVFVQDSGIGLTPAQIEQLFTPFHQADVTTTRKYGGTGLGLSICKRLVTLMEGTIGVVSEAGHGSTFWFTLPFARPEEPNDYNLTPSLQDLPVMVVASNAQTSAPLVTTLQNWQLEVTTTTPETLHQQLLAAGEHGQAMALLMTEEPQIFERLKHLAHQLETNCTYPVILVLPKLTDSASQEPPACEIPHALAITIPSTLLFATLNDIKQRWDKDISSATETMECNEMAWMAPQQLSSDDDLSAIPTLDRLDVEEPPFSLPGLELEQSAKLMGPNGWGVLRRVLESFYQDFQHAPEQIDTAIGQQDFATAARLVHTIKGLATTIGAETLYELAVPFNQQLQQNNAALQDEFQQQLRQVLMAIKPLLTMPSGAATPSAIQPAMNTDNVLDLTIVLPKIKELQSMLASGQSKARRLSTEIETLVANSPLQEPYARIARPIARLDFETALRSLQQLAASQGWKLE